MAACSGTQLTVDWLGLETDVVNMSDWTIVQDSDSRLNEDRCMLHENYSESNQQKRSNIVHAIIHNHSLDHLGTILGSGWDVNETLWIPDHGQTKIGDNEDTLLRCYEQRTALGEAARQGWTAGAKVLLDAGANCNMSSGLRNPLILALRNRDGPPEIIALLLKHGADSNHYDERLKCRPLLCAVLNCKLIQNATKIILILLEHGADPNVNSTGNDEQFPLFAALGLEFNTFSVVFKMLAEFGADVNYHVGEYRPPVVYGILTEYGSSIIHLQELLDTFFQHGGNIHKGYHRLGTVLEFAVESHSGPGNHVRWLLRHGADISTIRFSQFRPYLSPDNLRTCFPDTALILLQAGMKVLHVVQTQLSNIVTGMSAWLRNDRQQGGQMYRTIETTWKQLKEVEEEEAQKTQFRKSTCPEYLNHQMIDLEEFSDSSLHMYPKEPRSVNCSCQHILDMVQPMLEFLGQPQSLQWHCRCYLRENLVSLEPSVVKNLPIPAILKRYIMCHEI